MPWTFSKANGKKCNLITIQNILGISIGLLQKPKLIQHLDLIPNLCTINSKTPFQYKYFSNRIVYL